MLGAERRRKEKKKTYISGILWRRQSVWALPSITKAVLFCLFFSFVSFWLVSHVKMQVFREEEDGSRSKPGPYRVVRGDEQDFQSLEFPGQIWKFNLYILHKWSTWETSLVDNKKEMLSSAVLSLPLSKPASVSLRKTSIRSFLGAIISKDRGSPWKTCIQHLRTEAFPLPLCLCFVFWKL